MTQVSPATLNQAPAPCESGPDQAQSIDESAGHPGRVLREIVMPSLSLTSDEVSSRTGLPRDVVDRLTEERLEVTPAMAEALEVLGMDRASWLAAQARYNEQRDKDLASDG